MKWHPLACFTQGAIRKLRKKQETQKGGLHWDWLDVVLGVPKHLPQFLKVTPSGMLYRRGNFKVTKDSKKHRRTTACTACWDWLDWVLGVPKRLPQVLKVTLSDMLYRMGDLAVDCPARWRWAYLGLWQSSSQLQMISPTLARWRWAYLGSAMLKPAKLLIRKLWRTARNTEEGRCALGLTWRAPGCPQTSPSGFPGWGRSLQAARWLPASPTLSLRETCPSIKHVAKVKGTLAFSM